MSDTDRWVLQFMVGLILVALVFRSFIDYQTAKINKETAELQKQLVIMELQDTLRQ